MIANPPRWVYELATAGYRWDNNAARYRSRDTGRFVSEKTIANDLNRFNVINDNLLNITDRMIDGRITLSQWQIAMGNELKDDWSLNQMVGRGGKEQMTQADYGRQGGRLRFEYDRLNHFAVEIKVGTLTPAQIRARVGLYARGPRVGYFDGLTAAKAASGFLFEQRFLRPGETCPDCVRYAAEGKVPIGTLPEPGEASQCHRNCNCVKVYSKEF